MKWTKEDDQMKESIIIELLTIIDGYEFLFEDPHATHDEIDNTVKGVRFKHKQIEWLEGLKERIQSPFEAVNEQAKKDRVLTIINEIKDIDLKISEIYGLPKDNTNISTVSVNIDQLRQVKSLEEQRSKLQNELNKLRES